MCLITSHRHVQPASEVPMIEYWENVIVSTHSDDVHVYLSKRCDFYKDYASVQDRYEAYMKALVYWCVTKYLDNFFPTQIRLIALKSLAKNFQYNKEVIEFVAKELIKCMLRSSRLRVVFIDWEIKIRNIYPHPAHVLSSIPKASNHEEWVSRLEVDEVEHPDVALDRVPQLWVVQYGRG
eukprot:757588-Hanusia_phi.AAC.1